MLLRHPTLRRALTRPAATLAAITVATACLVGGLAAPASATGSTGTVSSTSPAKVTKVAGQGVTFTFTFTSGGKALAGKPVTLYTRPTTSSTWTKVATHTLNSYGKTAMAFTVARSTYALAKFMGDAKYAGTSTFGTVTVSALGQQAVTEAARHKGAPYQYGAVGPTRFDCSGFTRYVWGRLGKSLPHNSAQQYGVVRHVAKSDRRVGDLIFIYEGGGIHHVGIYAGNGYMWHAPKTGDVVKKAPIWTQAYYVGRVA
jgi:cell wall-associated NlpC family hydrolase